MRPGSARHPHLTAISVSLPDSNFELEIRTGSTKQEAPSTIIRIVTISQVGRLLLLQNVSVMPRPPLENWGSSPLHLFDDILRAVESLGTLKVLTIPH